MKKVLISLIAVLIIATAISVIMSNSYAAFDFKGEISSADIGTDNSGASDSAAKITGALLTIFRIAAVGIAMIMLVVVAIKYMSAAPEGKAEIKKHAVIYVVGAVVLFASSGILGIIQNFAASNIKASE
jgi:hypothetical protein